MATFKGLKGADGKSYDVDAATQEEAQAKLDAHIKPPPAPAIQEEGAAEAARIAALPWAEKLQRGREAGASGLRSGIEGMIGMGGDLPALAGKGAGWVAGKLGAGEDLQSSLAANVETTTAGPGRILLKALQLAGVITPEQAASAQAVMQPTSTDVASVTDPLVSAVSPEAQAATRMQPGNAAERMAFTGGSLLPNPSRGFVRNVVGPAIGTEIGGQIGEKLGYGDVGRFVGGVGGAAAPGAGMRAVAGPPMDPRRARQVQTMIDEGIPLTGGQATGRKRLQYAEAGPFEGKAEAIAGQQQTALNRAALRRAGVVADDAGPDTMVKARDDLGLEYEDLVARNNGVPMDQTLQDELLNTTVGYQRLKGTAGPQVVEDYFNRITEAAQANGGVIPPDVFQTIRSDISTTLRTATDGETIMALRRLQDSLFDGIARNGQPEIVEAARDLNNRYRNFKVIERAMEGAGEATALGDITPRKLLSAVAKGDKGALVYGRGDMSDLAKAAQVTMTDLPQSGTAARAAPFAAAGALGGAVTQAAQGNLLTAAGLAAAPVLPWAASKVASSRPFSRAVIEQATGRGPLMLNPITAALLARQQELAERKGQ